MFKDLRLIIVNHMGAIIAAIAIIIAVYFICIEVFPKAGTGAQVVDYVDDVLDNSSKQLYNNNILTGSQVLATIEKYYNNSDMVLLLFNNSLDYNKDSYRFFVTGTSCKYGQNTNYENIIISNDYDNISGLFVQANSIKNNGLKKSLASYKDLNAKNYINISKKYKSVLLKSNNVIVGIAFLAI